METQPVTFRLPPELYERLRRVSFETRIPMNTIVVRATENILADEEALADLEVDYPPGRRSATT